MKRSKMQQMSMEVTVGAFMFMIHSFAQIMQQTHALGYFLVKIQLRSHDTG